MCPFIYSYEALAGDRSGTVMAITVQELLAESQLGLTLLAGGTGVQATISWAHTSDLTRLWEWVTGGELMMTNGLSIPADRAGQSTLAENLSEAGASALAVGENMHAPDDLSGLTDACNRLALPLIAIPYPLPFIAIARAVAEATLLEQSERVRRTARLYDVIRKLGDSNWTLTKLVHEVAKEMRCKLFVVHRRCSHPWHASEGVLPSTVTKLLKEEKCSQPARGGLNRVTNNERHILTLEIPANDRAMLVVVPPTGTRPDTTLLLHAATVIGLNLSQHELELENRRRTGAELFRQILDGHPSASDVQIKLTALDVFADNFIVLAMSTERGSSLEHFHGTLLRHGHANAAFDRHGILHVAVNADCPEPHILHCTDPGTRIGISQPTSASAAGRAVQESLWALASAKESDRPLRRYDQQSLWLGLASVDEGETLVNQTLGPLLTYERDRKPELLNTLRAFLGQRRSWQKTAAAMHTHRQTIVYRIKRVGQILNMDINETSSIAQIWLALTIHDGLSPEEAGRE